MNRQFKFRIWDKEYNQLVYPKWLTLEEYDVIRVGCCRRIFKPNYVIQQFTGLTDKNGKEIYEGDIIKETVKKGPNLPERFKDRILKDNEKQHVAEITWGYYSDGEYVDKIECFMFGDRSSLSELIHRTTGNYHEWLFTYEVIGNIFESPELLNPVVK